MSEWPEQLLCTLFITLLVALYWYNYCVSNSTTETSHCVQKLWRKGQ